MGGEDWPQGRGRSDDNPYPSGILPQNGHNVGNPRSSSCFPQPNAPLGGNPYPSSQLPPQRTPPSGNPYPSRAAVGNRPGPAYGGPSYQITQVTWLPRYTNILFTQMLLKACEGQSDFCVCEPNTREYIF